VKSGGFLSKIFFPYIYHGSIAHKYYVNMGYRLSNDPAPKRFSAIFSTGIRELYDIEYETAYIHLLDQIMLYDVSYIPIEDIIYLIGILGFDDTIKIVDSGAIHLYDALSNRIGLLFGPVQNIMMFSDKSPESDRSILARIDKMLLPMKKKMSIKDEWKPIIAELFKKAYFINDIQGLFLETENETLKDLNNKEIRTVIEASPAVTSNNLLEEQLKLNRLLHFHYYRRISKLLECDYMFVPVELEGLYNYYSNLDLSGKDQLGLIFSKITKLERIPDIPQLIKENILTIDDILEIRKSKAAQNFRKWIDALNKTQGTINDPDVYTSLYHEACMSNNKFKEAYNSKKGTTLRTISLLALGAASSGLGIGLTLFDYLVSVGLDDFNPATYTREKLRKHINSK